MKHQDPLPTFRKKNKRKNMRRILVYLSPVISLGCFVAALYLAGYAQMLQRETEKLEQQQESHGVMIHAGQNNHDDSAETDTIEQLQVVPADDITEVYITPRMTYTYECYDARTGELICQEEPIPNEMYGLNRVELEQFLTRKSSTENEMLSDIQYHYEIREFSRRSFTVRQTITQVYAVFLIAEEGYVVAYSGDRTQLYELTHIPLEEFPMEQQTMLTSGIYMKTMSDYYDFLETYSS